jgi:hypothetical protein
MPRSRHLILLGAVLLLLAASVAFLIPAGRTDGPAWALLVIALAGIAAWGGAPERSEIRDSRDSTSAAQRRPTC